MCSVLNHFMCSCSLWCHLGIEEPLTLHTSLFFRYCEKTCSWAKSSCCLEPLWMHTQIPQLDTILEGVFGAHTLWSSKLSWFCCYLTFNKNLVSQCSRSRQIWSIYVRIYVRIGRSSRHKCCCEHCSFPPLGALLSYNWTVLRLDHELFLCIPSGTEIRPNPKDDL